jgi:hypothetical protein
MNKDLEIENLKARVIDLEEKLLIFINNTDILLRIHTPPPRDNAKIKPCKR